MWKLKLIHIALGIIVILSSVETCHTFKAVLPYSQSSIL